MASSKVYFGVWNGRPISSTTITDHRCLHLRSSQRVPGRAVFHIQRVDGPMFPELTRDLLGIRAEGGVGVVDLGGPLCGGKGGPTWITRPGECRPSGPHGVTKRFGHNRGLTVVGKVGRPTVEVSEHERNIGSVWRTQRTAEARDWMSQLVEVGAATSISVRLCKGKGRHSEQPVGVDQFVELSGAGTGICGSVRRGVTPRSEGAQRSLGLSVGDGAESPSQGEVPGLVTLVSRRCDLQPITAVATMILVEECLVR